MILKVQHLERILAKDQQPTTLGPTKRDLDGGTIHEHVPK